jgi:4-amino-4-deoxy-L-arabinose transferase-like glycosyltransferase
VTPRAWLLGILIAGAALRLYPYWFGLPHLQARPDETVAAGVALGILDGDPNPHFFHWPSLTFYLFAAVFWAARGLRRMLSPDTPFTATDSIVIGRVVVAAAGTATLAVLFSLGRRVADATTGLIAAALLAVAILHVRESHFAMTDVLMTFFVTASLALVLRGYDAAVAERPALRWFAASGALAGLAASTKYNAAAAGGAMLAAQCLLMVRSRRIAGLLPLVVYSVLFAVGFLVASPYAVLDFAKFKEDVLFDITHLSGGHGVDLGRGWIYHLKRSLPFGLGPLTFVAALVGLFPFARRYPRHGVILAGFALPLYLSIGSGYTVFFRYILPIVPVLCLTAAVGVCWAAGRLHLRAALPLLLGIVVGVGFLNSLWFDVLLARRDSRVVAADWLATQLQPEQTLHDAGGDYTKLDLNHLSFHEWHFDAQANTFRGADGRVPDWLVLYESPVYTYARVPWQLRTLADTRYALAHAVVATTGKRRDAVYDLQDAFFMPVWGLWTVERPGPTVLIYRRRDGPQ